MDINLDNSILKKYDHSLQTELKEHYNNGCRGGFGQYNLLAHLSTYFYDEVIIDIGTGGAAVSARALAYNKTNKVISYDIEFCEAAKGYLGCLDNVEYKNINPLKDSTAQALMLLSPLIYLDVDPHDGIQEQEFYDFFVKNNWKGIMICDDIMRELELNNTSMAAFWDGVDKPKYDLTKTTYTHSTGTGIICFGDQEINNSFVFSADDLKYREKHFSENPNNWSSMVHKEIIRYDDGTFETNDGITGTWEITIVNEKRTFIIKNWAGTFVMPIDNWTPEIVRAIVDPEYR